MAPRMGGGKRSRRGTRRRGPVTSGQACRTESHVPDEFPCQSPDGVEGRQTTSDDRPGAVCSEDLPEAIHARPSHYRPEITTPRRVCPSGHCRPGRRPASSLVNRGTTHLARRFPRRCESAATTNPARSRDRQRELGDLIARRKHALAYPGRCAHRIACRGGTGVDRVGGRRFVRPSPRRDASPV